MHPSQAAVRRARSWARGALRLEAGRSWDPDEAVEPLEDLLEAVRRHRLVELIGAQAEALGLPDPLARSLRQLRTIGRRELTVQILETARIHRLLVDAGIECLVIKGAALAVQTTGDPAARGAGDVDVLVAPEQVEQAHRLLTSHGWSFRPGTEVVPGTWAWKHVIRSFNAFTYDGPGSTVDLHWRLDPTLDALPSFAEIWDRRAVVDLGSGVQVPTLSALDVLAHTSLNASKDTWRWLRNVVDVHRLAGLPATWERSLTAEPLRRLEISTLAVTRFTVGLPPTVPREVLARLDQVPATTLNRAVHAQERPAAQAFPFPGTESARLLRYLVTASTTRRDLTHSVVGTLIPAQVVVGLRSRTAWTGVPLTMVFRVRRLGRRLLAWTRRAPGAGVLEPIRRSR